MLKNQEMSITHLLNFRKLYQFFKIDSEQNHRPLPHTISIQLNTHTQHTQRHRDTQHLKILKKRVECVKEKKI